MPVMDDLQKFATRYICSAGHVWYQKGAHVMLVHQLDRPTAADTVKYRRVPGKVIRKGSRDVVEIDQGVEFMCPCGDRSVYAASPPHSIAFDKDDVLTLDPSCGYGENSEHPANWCHFHIHDGVPKMVDDAQCPGNA